MPVEVLPLAHFTVTYTHQHASADYATGRQLGEFAPGWRCRYGRCLDRTAQPWFPSIPERTTFRHGCRWGGIPPRCRGIGDFGVWTWPAHHDAISDSEHPAHIQIPSKFSSALLAIRSPHSDRVLLPLSLTASERGKADPGP